MSSISESLSLQSLSLSQSTKSSTKPKLPTLKPVLKKKLTTSKEKLLDNVETTSLSRNNPSDQERQFNINKNDDEEEKISKKFILDKFLSDSNSMGVSNTSNDTVVGPVKPPVPKPRKKFREQRRGSATSTGTFKVTSPKILKSPNQEASVHLFNVASSSKEKPYFKDGDTEINNDKNAHIIGDLVLHKSPTLSKVTVVSSHSSVILEKADNETICDASSSYSRGTFILDKDSDSENTVQKDNLDEETAHREVENRNKLKKPKPKKRLQKQEKDKSSKKIQDAKNDTQSYTYQNITEIKIHKTDKLLLKSFVIHPVVKIHIVDIRTGKYFRKSDKNRPVVFYYENDNNDYILPVMTSFYNLQEKRSFYPMWEETILLNEDFEYIVNENVIIFFEVMDFATTNFETIGKNKDCEKGWYKIAFAFLRLVGKNNALNVNKKVRLQLYYPQNINVKRAEHNICQLWSWWHNKNLKKYPSTLYITIKKVISPTKVIETLRSKTPLQKEDGNKLINRESNRDSTKDDRIKQDAENLKLKWQNKLHKDNKLPEKCYVQLDTSDEGCFVLKFSNNGLYLACSIKIKDDFQTIVYLVPEFKETYRFKSHQALVYTIIWSKDDKYLLSASSDNTVAIWNFEDKLFFQILPHPSFVYTCEISAENVISTGGYDKILRIWNFNKETNTFELYQELEGHKGYLTSLCFTHKNTEYFYSSDSCGIIMEWHKSKTDWEYNRKLDIVDLRETKINQIIVFSNDKKMLVHSRDSALRIISIANVCVMHWLHGALNTRVQTFCDISLKWSSYVASGSENGLVIVWDANSGKDVKTYEGYSNKLKGVHNVQFHPKLNMLAVSHYGSNEPVLIFYDNGEEIQDVDGKTEAEVKNTGISEDDIPNKDRLDFRTVLQKMDQLLM